MNNFLRAIRLALQFRWTFAASLVCAIAVGVLWGGNISAIYPFVEVVFKGQSLHDWVEERQQKSQRTIASLEAESKKLAESPSPEAVQERKLVKMRLHAERRALSHYQTAAPYIHRFLPDDPFQTLLVIIVAMLVATLLKDVFLIAHQILISRLSEGTTYTLRKEFFRHTLRMELAHFQQHSSGELISHFTYDLQAITNGVRAVLGKAVREPLKMAACLIGAAIVCWQLLVLSFIVAPLAGLLISRLTKLLKRANKKAMEEMSQMYGTLEETFQGIKTIKAFNSEQQERRRFHEQSKRYLQKAMKIARYDALTRPTTETMGIICISVALLGGAYLVLNQETHLLGIRMCERPLSLGSILLFFGLLAGVSDPGRKMSDVFSRLQQAAAAADRIYALLDQQPGIHEIEKPRTLGRHRQEIAFERVQFGYVPDKPVLEEVDLTIQAGETVAFVGPNGCGKSTLANLIPRFYDPQQGRVKIDGIDVRELRLRELRGQIGLVTQQPLLFDETIENNIRYGSPLATRDQVIAAAKQAHAHEFILERLENGYDTPVGQGAHRLSGGQRQRIALARAILRDPAILILDEATSQVDLESEQLIHRVLEEFKRDRTTLMITHRLAALSLADRIVVMDAGRIVDMGTHNELIGRCPLYQRLHQADYQKSA